MTPHAAKGEWTPGQVSRGHELLHAITRGPDLIAIGTGDAGNYGLGDDYMVSCGPAVLS